MHAHVPSITIIIEYSKINEFLNRNGLNVEAINSSVKIKF
jgi:hypothetical protein